MSTVNTTTPPECSYSSKDASKLLVRLKKSFNDANLLSLSASGGFYCGCAEVLQGDTRYHFTRSAKSRLMEMAASIVEPVLWQYIHESQTETNRLRESVVVDGDGFLSFCRHPGYHRHEGMKPRNFRQVHQSHFTLSYSNKSQSLYHGCLLIHLHRNLIFQLIIASSAQSSVKDKLRQRSTRPRTPAQPL